MTDTSATGTGVSAGSTTANRPAGFLSPEAMLSYLSDRLEARLVDSVIAYGQLTAVVAPEAWADAARLCKEDPALSCRFWDFLDAVDRGEDGFDCIAHIYSIEHHHEITLQTRVPGGREDPVLPSLTGVFRGANWGERETYDMFGIEFEGHPGVRPRLLTIENFEGWPLRKDFQLSSRNAKPWPGAKEPEEHKPAGEAADGDTAVAADPPAAPEDKAAAAKAKAERAKAKAAAMRAQKAAERAEAQSAAAGTGSDLIAESAEQFGGGDTEGEAAAAAATAAGDETAATPEGAAAVAESAIAKDAAAGLPQGDVAEGSPQDVANVDEPVENPEGEAAAAEGAPPTASATPGIEADGRHGGAEVQSGDRPAADTPGMTSDTQGLGAARSADEVPAPGPDSDQPLTPGPGQASTPHGGAPTPQEDDVPVVPAQGSAAAPLDSDMRPEDADDERHGLERETLGVESAQAAEGGSGPDQNSAGEPEVERVEEGPAPHPGTSERVDAADRDDPNRDLASDHAVEDDDGENR